MTLTALPFSDETLWSRLRDEVRVASAFATMRDRRPGLLATTGVRVPPAEARAIAGMVAALDRAFAVPDFAARAVALAGGEHLPDHGANGGLLGLDFHLGPDGPRLIEINTNPGGLLVAAAQARAMIPDTADVEALALAVFQEEWRRERGDAPLSAVAIVDEDPAGQYLQPEFELYRALFESAGLNAVIAAPHDLEHRDGTLLLDGRAIDLVYNRFTDFMFERPESAALHAAWADDSAVIVPDPRAHALYTDKRLLSLLCDGPALTALGVSDSDAASIAPLVPRTVIGDAQGWEALWRARRGLFFKPAKGHAGKAAYRGDKISRTTFDTLSPERTVAQDFVPAPRIDLGGDRSLKVDLRAFAYGGQVLLLAARLYEGQTTNFRTPGGGFAAVMVG